MRHLAPTLRRAFRAACLGLLLLPRLAVALPARAVDFDGDGQSDGFALDRQDASLLRVWLSASNSVHVIRSRVPLEDVTVADLDGDHRPELVARDRQSQLHVWTRGHKGFRAYRARHAVNATIGQTSRRAIHDGDSDAPGALTDTSFVPWVLLPRWSPRAFRVKTFATRARPRAPSGLAPTVEPFAPRPPPTFILL